MKTNYVLITPAHNEAQRIDKVIACIVSQTIRPTKWVIVNDGSTDNTEQILADYEKEHDFLVQLQPERSGKETYYGYRTQAVLAGYKAVEGLRFDFVAFLDSDLTIAPSYYESILTEFDRNPKLGIATGVYINEMPYGLEKVVRDNISTPGGLQMFRRACFEDIGGYRLMKYGGDDSLADIMARMHGWQTQSFPAYEAIHHRPTGTAGGKHILKARFYQGYTEYSLATHPLFMLAKSFRRAFVEKPYLIGSTARLLGFVACGLKDRQRCIPEEAAEYVRKEQLRRLLGRKKETGS